jgi:hypothetical protein
MPPKCTIIDDLGLSLLKLEDYGLEEIVWMEGLK